MEKILVVTVTYNGEKWIEKCISSIDEREGIYGLIIDNGSTDNTIKIIQERKAGIKIVNPGKNLGFGQGNNIGFKYAIDNGYDYVYLLNQDAWIEPKDILNLVEISKNNPDFGIISPMHVYRDKNRLDKDFHWAIPKELNEDIILGNPVKEIYSTDKLIPAAHWLIPLKALKIVGGFSPVFTHFGEDDNRFQRNLYHGFKAGMSPAVLGVHDREDRVMDKKYKLKINTSGVRHLLSNPYIKGFPYKNFIKTFIKMNLKYGSVTLGIFRQILKDYPSIKKARIQSRSKGAFLKA